MLNIKVAKILSLLWGGTIAGSGLGFITQALVARNLGTDSYGSFSAALVAVTLIAPLAGFGIQSFWLKVFGQEGYGAKQWLPASKRYVVASIVLAISLLFLWSFTSFKYTHESNLIYILLPHMLGLFALEIISAKLLLENRNTELSIWQSTPSLIRFFIVTSTIYLLPNKLTPLAIAIAYSLAAIIMICVGSRNISQMFNGNINLHGHNPTDKPPPGQKNVSDVYLECWPFGLATIFHLIYFQSNIVFLDALIDSHTAGIYASAFTIISAIYILPNVIYNKYLLPKFHRWASHDISKFVQVYKQGNKLMLLIGVSTGIGLYFSGPLLAKVAFGPSFSEAGNIISALAVCVPLRFLSTSIGASLVTKENMKNKVKLMGIVAAINIALNCFAIPNFGLIGAISTTIISEGLLLTLYYYSSIKLFSNLEKNHATP